MLPDCRQCMVVDIAYEEWHKSRSIATKHSTPNILMAKATQVVAVKGNLDKLGANMVLLLL